MPPAAEEEAELLLLMVASGCCLPSPSSQGEKDCGWTERYDGRHGASKAPCFSQRLRCENRGCNSQWSGRSEFGQRWLSPPARAQRRGGSALAPGTMSAAASGITASVAPASTRTTVPVAQRSTSGRLRCSPDGSTW